MPKIQPPAKKRNKAYDTMPGIMGTPEVGRKPKLPNSRITPAKPQKPKPSVKPGVKKK